MKAVILAGGYGTRISEETSVRPKPMVEIGGKPILWHIMKTYSKHGINDFIICCGYKGHVIKEYFANYYLQMSDFTFDMQKNEMEIHKNNMEPWKVTVVDTGDGTLKGGRLKRVSHFIGNERFCLTYGDGVSNVNITELIGFHDKTGGVATLTAVQPPGRFGAFSLGEDQTTITNFREKPTNEGAWINGGFFVLEPEIMNYIEGDHTDLEKEPMEQIAREGKLSAYRHYDFWHPMDTLRDKNALEEMWSSDSAPWKVWE